MGRQLDWIPEVHEARILHLLGDSPLTFKGLLGGLAHWWTRSDCADALARLVECGEVVQIRRRFVLTRRK
jgi:hypothetical protein